MKIAKQTVLPMILFLSMMLGLLVLLVVVLTDLRDTTHITAMQMRIGLCEETKECFGSYIVRDGRVFRIDNGKSLTGEPQVISLDDLLLHMDDENFLKSIEKFVLQSDRGQWLLYAKKRAEQISEEHARFRGRTASAN